METSPPEETQVETKEIRTVERKVSSTPSIKDALQSLHKTVNSANSDAQMSSDDLDLVSEADSDQNEAKHLSPEKIQKCWEEFIKELKKNQARMYNALRNQELEVKDNQFIQVFFRNNAQIEDFKLNIKPTLLSSLRAKLESTEVQIVEVLRQTEDAPQTKHYSDQDKLKHMMEKNPYLKKLYQDFNLDFE